MVILTIKKPEEFQKVGKNGQKFFAKSLFVLSKKSPEKYSCDILNGKNAEEFVRIGYTVSKKISKLANKRNLVKRRFREAFKKLSPTYCKNGFDYVVIAKKEVLEVDFNKILSDLKFCLRNIHRVAKNEKK